MSQKPVALIEIGGSHDECLLSQLCAIHAAGRKTLLITTPEVIDRNPAFQDCVDEFFPVDMSRDKSSKKKGVGKIWDKLKSEGVEKVVLNTAQGNLVRLLCWKALFHKVEFVGVIHTTRMFTESFTQKLIHKKVKKYLLLSEYLLSTVIPPRGIQLDYFYPIRFHQGEKTVQSDKKLITIIGGVENRRKDLAGFTELIKSLKRDDVQFVFLGKSDPSNEDVKNFQKEIEKSGLSGMVRTFDHFVDQDTFDAHLKATTLILPIVHPDTPSADQYFKNQISGAMSVAFGYKIPMLIHKAYAHIEEMQAASFYYEQSQFSTVLDEALVNSETKRADLQNNPKYHTETQEKRFVDFVLG